METGSAARVGLFVLVGLAIGLAAWWFLSHASLNRYAVRATFDDVKGLQEQTPVRMNGVSIGEVKRVRLDSATRKPIVTLAIGNDYKIPEDSSIAVTSGILISNPLVEITPGKSVVVLKDGDVWRGRIAEPVGALAQLSPETSEAVRQLTITVKTLTPQLEGTIKDLRGILKRTEVVMANVQDASYSAKNLIGNPQIRVTMDRLLADMQAVSQDARRTASTVSAEMRGVVKRNSGKFDALANGAVDLLQRFADTVDAARGAVTKLTEQVSDPRLQQSLIETLDLAKTTLARFNQIATDIHSISGDPTVQNDLKTTVSTLRETTEEGQKLVERINTLVGSLPTGKGGPRFGLGRPELAIDFLGRGNTPHFRSDINVRLPIGDKNALNLGIYDFAERNKLNAQYETKIGPSALRYGIYASKLGMGLDWRTAPGTSFRLDAYNPNSFQLDAKALFRVSDDFSLWLGAESLFKRTTPAIGVRLSR
jgi:phospholipid/cholesterol/gamma-HCH transport system substrate-binding protein